MKQKIIKNIQKFIIQEQEQTMYASWKNKNNDNLEPGYLIHQNGSFFCVGMIDAQEKQPGYFGNLDDLSLSEIKNIENNLCDSSGFIGDLTDFIDFYKTALPNINSTQFFHWCRTGTFQ